MKVINLQKELLGQVKKLMETGANDVLVVSPTEDSIDKVERLIPFLKERVIKTVNRETGEILVDWESSFLTDQK
jgi:16S rRNA processing protein RimM